MIAGFGGWMWALIDILLVVILGAAIAYGTLRWREHRSDLRERAVAESATAENFRSGATGRDGYRRAPLASVVAAIGLVAFAALVLVVGLSWQSGNNNARDNQSADIAQQTAIDASGGNVGGPNSRR